MYLSRTENLPNKPNTDIMTFSTLGGCSVRDNNGQPIAGGVTIQEQPMKQCTKCKETKPRSEFYKRKQNRDGLRSWCKRCEIDAVGCYQKTEAGKAIQHCYNVSEKGRAKFRRFEKTPKARARASRYNASEKGKAYHYKRRKRHPNRTKARDAVNNAIQAGILEPVIKFQCAYDDCDCQAQEYHHHLGYTQDHWLDVQPFCITHHRMIDNQD